MTRKISKEWSSILVTKYKNKGDTQKLQNYRGIKVSESYNVVWESMRINLGLCQVDQLWEQFITKEINRNVYRKEEIFISV